MNNFENRNEFLNLDNIYNKAWESLEEDRIEMDDFKRLYGDRRVEEDKKEVEKRKNFYKENNSNQEKEAKKLATIFEAIINENLELSEWLGENAQTMPTTEYDDFVNGVDTIIEFIEEDKNPSHLGMAIDATYSSELGKKFTKIKENIDKEKLATIKYFKSINMDFMGEKSQIPRVIVGADNNTIKELIELWYTGKKKELGEHPIQFQIMEEILIQLESFMQYAKKINKPGIKEKFRIIYNIIEKIQKEKEKEFKDKGVDTSVRDDMFETIKSYTEKFSV